MCTDSGRTPQQTTSSTVFTNAAVMAWAERKQISLRVNKEGTAQRGYGVPGTRPGRVPGKRPPRDPTDNGVEWSRRHCRGLQQRRRGRTCDSGGFPSSRRLPIVCLFHRKSLFPGEDVIEILFRTSLFVRLFQWLLVIAREYASDFPACFSQIFTKALPPPTRQQPLTGDPRGTGATPWSISLARHRSQTCTKS